METMIKNRGTSCVGVCKTGTTLIRVSTVMGTLYRPSAQIANLNCIEQKAFMGGNFQWNKNDRYVVSMLLAEG